MAYVKLASAATTGGHSYWRDTDTGAILVADGSMRAGNDPTSTDDGRLEVDRARIFSEGIRGSAEGGDLRFTIPLVGGYTAGAWLREAAWVAGFYHALLTVTEEGETYRITRVEVAK